MARHGVLSSSLGNFNQVDETTLTLFETTDDGLLRELREIFVLHDEVMKIISQVVGTCGSTMPVKDSEETDLWPLHVEVLLALGLEDVQDN